MTEPTMTEKITMVTNSLMRNVPLINPDLIILNDFSSEIGGFNHTYVFENRARIRRLEIYFWPGNLEFSDVFVVRIINEKNKRLALAQYLYLIGFLSETTLPFSFNSYSGTFNEKLEQFLNFLDSALREATVRDILVGKNWVDLPFDWGGVK